ncbi:MAG: hypothetical protein KGZ25_11805, partial [Planctomycetes bacterium]|nr:hypothetical protein [Planctomycetota bacterium]
MRNQRFYSFATCLPGLFIVLFLSLALGHPISADAQETTLTIDKAETAQISGFQSGWDEPILDNLKFDAVHRRLLVRFPDAAEQISHKLEKGHAIKKVELLLPFRRTEVFPEGYNQRGSFGVKKKYQKVRPNWHAVAWALRDPWKADRDLGPTFNAWIKDTAFWNKAGAESKKSDIFSKRFGPTRVSIFQAKNLDDPMVGPEALGAGPKYVMHADKQPGHKEAIIEDPTAITPARMDVTASVTDRSFGDSLGERLRRLADCGFMLCKWETYDFRFRQAGSYPWAASTGGRAIEIHPPRLSVTFSKGDSVSVSVPPRADVASLAQKLKGTEKAGSRPLEIPSDKEIQRRLDNRGFKRREWMSDWQWERLKELRSYHGRSLPQSPEEYKKWVKTLLKEQPRYWAGWDNAERLLEYYRYESTLPDYVSNHYFYNYWSAWLQPDTPTSELVHPMSNVGNKWGQLFPLKYYRKTGDWRGNASFYRRGFTHNTSTMNFNHTASMGALLGGAIIDSEYAMKDGRYGLEHYPLRQWTWLDGSTQESIDHYYFALTLVAQKMFADFGPKHIDRMMGRSILAKSVEELVSAYHPHLRHFLASSTRTGTPDYLLATQDGTQHVVHTLSRKGALHDLNKGEIPHGMKRFGNDVSPVEAQQMTMVRPWAPKWFANLVDKKPLPYKMTNAYTEWGHHKNNPLWRRTYLGEHYGLASTDFTAGTVQILGQWRRDGKTVRKVQQLGTMDVIYGINTSHLGNPGGGWRPKHGMQATLHHENKMIVVTSPQAKHLKRGKKVSELKSTIAFYNYEEPEPSWKIYVDEEPVNSIPATANTEQLITIHDGESYIGIIPLPATDLGGGGVRLHQPEPQTSKNTGVETQARLAIESYNLKTEKAQKVADRLKEMDAVYGGWIIEYGDSTEYEDFNDFQNHMENAVLETSWNPDDHVMDVTYKSGDDTLEMGVNTMYHGGRRGNTAHLFRYRKVNGKWPYLEKNLSRDTTITQQGRAPVLKKNGATLRSDRGTMGYLQTDPVSGTFVGFNPLPEMSFFQLQTPGKVKIQPDGRVGITRVMVRPSENIVRIDHALKDKQKER